MFLPCGWLDLLAILFDSWHVLSDPHFLLAIICQVFHFVVFV